MKQYNVQWNTSNGHSPMANLACMFHPLSAEAIKFIDQHTFKVKVAKGDHVMREGEICRYIYFVEKGVLRSYFREGSKDITTWITSQNEMATSIKGFETQMPCYENIQAIEECELVAAEYEVLQYMYEHFMEMNIVARKLYERYYRDAEERAFITRLSKAVDKYKHFVATKGDLINRIPLKYVASYLGMTIETLSRMRTQLSKEASRS